MSGSRERVTYCRNRKRRSPLLTKFADTRLISSRTKRRITAFWICGLSLASLVAPPPAHAQQALTWDQVKAKFEADNPAMKADADNVDEMKAEEITAFLRPNPQFTLAADGTQAAPHNGVWTHFKGTFAPPNVTYLHERD